MPTICQVLCWSMNLKEYRHLPVPDGEYQRRESVKMLINMVLYALTANPNTTKYMWRSYSMRRVLVEWLFGADISQLQGWIG